MGCAQVHRARRLVVRTMQEGGADCLEEERDVRVLTKAQADFLIAGMRSNFPHQLNCDACGKPLGDDRHEVMHGPFPLCVHGKCRDLMMSYKLDRRAQRHGSGA